MKKGYKGFTKKGEKMYCLNMQYEIGKTYEVIGEIVPCENGIHYCEKLEDVFDYYSIDRDTVFCEIEDLGDTKREDNKYVTDKIKIGKKLSIDEINLICENIRIDEYGNMIYRKNSYEIESFWEYDEKGNKIHEKNEYENESFWEYDEKGHLIYEKDCYGKEYFWEYDDKGNKIYEKDCYGNECFWKYDDKGNIIEYRNNNIITKLSIA